MPDRVAAARAALLDSRPCRYRTFTWWSTSAPEERRRAQLGEPAAGLFLGSGYHRWYEAARGQMPRMIATHDWGSGGPRLTSAASRIDLQRSRTWLFVVPTGAVVAGLQLDFDDRDPKPGPRPVLELFEDVDSGRERLRVGGRPVLEACTMGGAEALGLELGFAGDLHHLLCFRPGGGQLAFNRDLLQRMVSRRNEHSRPEHLTATFPAELNRYEDGFAAVTPGATVMAGQPPHVEFAASMNAVLALSSLAALREVQNRAFAALQELRDPSNSEPEWLAKRAVELRGLELDLSFGVESHLEMRVLVPSLPIEQLHRDLVEALALRRGATVAGGMLARLSSAIAAEDARLRLEERRSNEQVRAEALRRAARERRLAARRRRAITAAFGVGGLFALPLAFLGTNSREVSNKRSIFDLAHYWPYYLTFVILVLGAVALVWAVGPRFDPDTEADTAEPGEPQAQSAYRADTR